MIYKTNIIFAILKLVGIEKHESIVEVPLWQEVTHLFNK